MDINLLLEKPEIDKNIKVIIGPLAPLSMIADIPGTYYKAQEVPDKYKLCGLFENILGWHFSKNDRAKIAKKIKDLNQKKLKNKDYVPTQANSGFQPLLFDFFEVGMIYRSQGVNYNDLWKRSFSRMDADVHPKGTPNLDYEVLKKKNWIKKKEEEQANIKKELKDLKDSGDESKVDALKSQLLPGSTSPLLAFFQMHKGNYPLYYTSPTLREYIDYSGGEIQMKLTIDSRLFNILSDSLKENSTAYLGNNEGWVEIKLEEL
ncbi:MAG: type I-PGING CRISPR-associated protein Cas5p [Saprospiraceae bacterium]|nr:type I-PGING CRISPR-associated protein Cas5p [Saprospiraceae bacterium]